LSDKIAFRRARGIIARVNGEPAFAMSVRSSFNHSAIRELTVDNDNASRALCILSVVARH
jgi:hypothetical protein